MTIYRGGAAPGTGSTLRGSAEDIDIADAGNIIDATNVEDALQEIQTALDAVVPHYVDSRTVTPPFLTRDQFGNTSYVPAHQWQPQGPESVIHTVLAPKGTGNVFLLPIEDQYNYTTGYMCADLQVGPSYGIDGSYNTGLGYTCFTTEEGDMCIAGGFNSGAGGGTGAISLGNATWAHGEGAAAFNGAYAYADWSFAYGTAGAVYGTIGKVAHGTVEWDKDLSGWHPGAAQHGHNVYAIRTTDATSTILTSNNTAPSVQGIDHDGRSTTWVKGDLSNVQVVPRSSTLAVTARVVAMQVDGLSQGIATGDFLDVEIKATVWRGWDTTDPVVILGTPVVTTMNRTAGAAAWVAELVINQTRRSVEIEVTGEAAKYIRWVCNFDTVEVG